MTRKVNNKQTSSSTKKPFVLTMYVAINHSKAVDWVAEPSLQLLKDNYNYSGGSYDEIIKVQIDLTSQIPANPEELLRAINLKVGE